MSSFVETRRRWLAAPASAKTGLVTTEHVVGFGNVNESICKHALEELDNA